MSTIKIQKPRKNANGTYEGLIFKNAKKDPVTLEIKAATVIDIKKTGPSEFYMVLKTPSKDAARQISIISANTISCVKENCALWFKNSLSDDLIEDYFTPNVMFDADRGQVIRIKCTNDISMLPQDACTNLLLSLKKIRFYKQKFVIEWEVEEAEIIDPVPSTAGIEDLESCKDSEEGEDPEPGAEELAALKDQYMSAVESRLDSLKREQSELLDALDRIRTASGFQDISSACDYIDKILGQ